MSATQWAREQNPVIGHIAVEKAAYWESDAEGAAATRSQFVDLAANIAWWAEISYVRALALLEVNGLPNHKGSYPGPALWHPSLNTKASGTVTGSADERVRAWFLGGGEVERWPIPTITARSLRRRGSARYAFGEFTHETRRFVWEVQQEGEQHYLFVKELPQQREMTPAARAAAYEGVAELFERSA